MGEYHSQVAIVGGGITGLWLLNRLLDAGYASCLLEKQALGCAQTFSSQGMIHGGLKYALRGFTTTVSETMAAMPVIWRDCLRGQGQVDLTGLDTLADDYYLFSDAAIGSRIAAFFASKSLRGRIKAVQPNQFPAPFQHAAFKGRLYRLEDMVLDTPSLIQRLRRDCQQHVFKADVRPIIEQDEMTGLDLGRGNRMVAERYVFAAGKGNAKFLQSKSLGAIQMQLRPLQQVMLRGRLPKVFAHGVGLRAAAKPRVTITTHPYSDTERIWYLGGNLAEQGVGRPAGKQIAAAKAELDALLPWIDLSNTRWATHKVDRAEPAVASHWAVARPDTAFVQRIHKSIVCWPIKLTLVPMLADAVMAALEIAPQGKQSPRLPLPAASIAKTPWELAFDH